MLLLLLSLLQMAMASLPVILLIRVPHQLQDRQLQLKPDNPRVLKARLFSLAPILDPMPLAKPNLLTLALAHLPILVRCNLVFQFSVQRLSFF